MILVIGTPCGGTSMAAGVLHHLGFDMGRCASRETVEGHVKPYMKFECEDMMAAFRDLGEMPELGKVHDVFREYLEERKGKLCGLKNFTVLFLSLVPELLEDLDFQTIYARRDMHDVLMSHMQVRGMDNIKAAERIGVAHLLMIRMLHIRPPVATVEYDRFLRNPEDETKHLAGALGVPWKREAADFIDPLNKGIVT